jgi:hypothetical protein
MLLKAKVARWKEHFPSRKLQKDSCATFVGTDGILLEVRNQKEGYCTWSRVATTSRILALSLLLLQD